MNKFLDNGKASLKKNTPFLDDGKEPLKKNTHKWWNKFRIWLTAKFTAEEEIIPADTAYCKATYGENTTIKNLIKIHQHKINKLINEKTSMRTNGDTFTDYRCVYSFPMDIEPYIPQILKVFIDNGYKVINLSDKIEDIQDEHVYLISWYKKHL